LVVKRLASNGLLADLAAFPFHRALFDRAAEGANRISARL
jgi:hypothetical protein